MRARMLTGLMLLTVALLVLTTFVVVYSRANDESRRCMRGDNRNKGEGTQDMTERTPGQCEAMQGRCNNATRQTQNQNENRRSGCPGQNPG